VREEGEGCERGERIKSVQVEVQRRKELGCNQGSEKEEMKIRKDGIGGGAKEFHIAVTILCTILLEFRCTGNT
jgi:hypothetical protein